MSTVDVCPEFPTTAHARMTMLPRSRELSAVIMYYCEENYVRVGGGHTLQCLRVNGEAVWTGSTIECAELDCSGSGM